MTRKEQLVREYVIKLLKESNSKEKEIIKHTIIWDAFYKKSSPFIKDLSYDNLAGLAATFLLFTVQYETVCIRAFKPLSGSQSTADDIIRMYSSKHRYFSNEPKQKAIGK